MLKRSAIIAIGMLTSTILLAADLARSDKNFIQAAAQAGHTEVEASKLAQSKSANGEVKSFAAMMIKDHTRVGADLDQLAAGNNVKVPTAPSVTQKARLKLLSTKEGGNFDKSYAKEIGIQAHEDAVKLFRKAAREAKDPEVKAFAEKTLPSLESHLEFAKSLSSATSAKK